MALIPSIKKVIPAPIMMKTTFVVKSNVAPNAIFCSFIAIAIPAVAMGGISAAAMATPANAETSLGLA